MFQLLSGKDELQAVLFQFYFFLGKSDNSQLGPHMNAECIFLYGPIHFPWQ